MKLEEMTVKDYIELLASDAPAPGGGSASALSRAQGAGLVTMAAGLTVGKKKYLDVSEKCSQLIKKSMPNVEALKNQIDRDTEAFNIVSGAFKMPKETDEQKKARSAEIQRGTLISTQVPFETMQMGLKGLKDALELTEGFNVSAASDLGVASLQLLACVKGAWLNVLINIGSLKDKQAAERYRTEGLEIVSESEKLAAEIYDRIEKIICQ